mmetsp:Transcript_27726/g.93157  ORF Transcript_27726/g.93157 Transcript_27726/m.93157 type:complete len:229 (-) Transcript_27726:252-938(-)
MDAKAAGEVDLAAVVDLHIFKGPLVGRLDAVQKAQNFDAADDAPERDCLFVQIGQRALRDEKLRRVRVRAAVGHGDDARRVELDRKGLVCEDVAGLAVPGPVEDVARLDPRAFDDAVERRPSVVEPRAGRVLAVLARAQFAEHLARFRANVDEELDHDLLGLLFAELDVQKRKLAARFAEQVDEAIPGRLAQQVRVRRRCREAAEVRSGQGVQRREVADVALNSSGVE